MPQNDLLMDYFADIATPLDILESIAKESDWPFERLSDHVLTLDVEGRWSACTLKFEWQEEFEALKFSCMSDIKMTKASQHKMANIIMDVNRQCWMGGFTVSEKEKNIFFTHTALLRGLPFTSIDFLETLVDAGLTEHDRFYPVLKGALNEKEPANDFIHTALFHTVGEA